MVVDITKISFKNYFWLLLSNIPNFKFILIKILNVNIGSRINYTYLNFYINKAGLIMSPYDKHFSIINLFFCKLIKKLSSDFIFYMRLSISL